MNKAKNTEARKPLGQGEHIRIRPIYCGKKCKMCPHHYYAYKVFREGKRVREKYLWKCDATGRQVETLKERLKQQALSASLRSAGGGGGGARSTALWCAEYGALN